MTFNKAKERSRGLLWLDVLERWSIARPVQDESIKSAGRPRNATELNSFLCTASYSSRFMEASRYQKAACNLGELVTGKFEWRQEHSEAFEVFKNMLSSDMVQAYFDPQAEHKLHIDGCPVGLAATLTQRKPGGSVGESCSMLVGASQTRRNGTARSSKKLWPVISVGRNFICSCTGDPLRF